VSSMISHWTACLSRMIHWSANVSPMILKRSNKVMSTHRVVSSYRTADSGQLENCWHLSRFQTSTFFIWEVFIWQFLFSHL
jgi:hypothetical protein